MRRHGVVELTLPFFLFCLLRTNGVFSEASHHYETHLMEWTTLPTGERVSSSERMHRHYMQTWKRRTAEAHAHQWRAQRDAAIASGSHGRKLSNSRSLAAANTTTLEVDALLAFRSSIPTDPTGALANWTSENEASHCTAWKGVTCDELGRVTEIELRDLGLNGTISPSLGDLAHLASLNLSGSSFWGEIPAALGRCQNLSMLDLSRNTLSGQVPAELFTLPSLEILSLSGNALSGRLPDVEETKGCQSMTSLWIDSNDISGTLPSSLSMCQNLKLLSLTNNSLNGSIPAALGELHQLQGLHLDYNGFSGPIPSELGSLTKLQHLDLEANHLEGEIPPFLGTLSELQRLNLKTNNLTGRIPPSLGNCSSLKNLMLGYNQLTGTFPEELGNLSSIEQFGFEYNWQLTGPVPGVLSKCTNLRVLFLGACGFTSIAPEIWSLKNLKQIALFSNNLTGTLPLEVGNCSSLEWLDLGWMPNQLHGSIPPTLGLLANLSTLSLAMNTFTGGIPPDLGNLKQLSLLWVARNYGLGGSIPKEVSNLTMLEDIDFGFCNLSGAIPEELFTNNPRISKLLLNNNNFSGLLPATVGKLRDLKTLYIQNNNFSGGIPTEIGGCASLTDMVLSNNLFNGTVPASIGQLSSLEATLDLSHNQLTGRLPRGLGNLTKLQRLIMSRNELNGTVPDDLGGCVSLNQLDLSSNLFTGEIPKFLGNYSGLVTLDLSSNAFDDDAATLSSLHECPKLQNIMVGQNKIHGSLPVDFTRWSDLTYFSVTRNNLTGPIPPSFRNISSSLVFADFSQNNFKGEFPSDVDGARLSKLRVLVFSHNAIEGPIPSWFGNLKTLQWLDLSSNKLSGPVPSNFGNLDGYKLQNSSWSNSPNGMFTLNQQLNLTFRGDSVSYSYILQATTFMDLSSNALTGEIPIGIYRLVGMKYLTLSNNRFQGQIWEAVQDLRTLETLDLSQNNLSGPLPPGLPSSLSIFKVFLNNLSGPIPSTGQYDSYPEAYYLPGNPGLCGTAIRQPCAGETGKESTSHTFRISDYMSVPAYGVGASCGFCFVTLTTIFWDPARVFVFEAPKRRSNRAQVQPAYSLFTWKF